MTTPFLLPTPTSRLRAAAALLAMSHGCPWAQPGPTPLEPAWPSAAEPADGSSSSPGLRVSGGVRIWSASWDSWNANPVGTGVSVGSSRYEVAEAMHSGEKLATIPFVSVRHGSVFVSASAMTDTSYSLHETGTPGGFAVNSSRSEFDLNLGYLFAPGMSLSLGNKRISQRFGPDEYKWNGPVLGLSAGAPLVSNWGLYTSLGLGRLKGKFPHKDAAGKQRFDSSYRLMEAGLTYTFTTPATWMRSLVLTTGYRTQRMVTRGYGLAQTPAVGVASQNTSAELVDTTQGFVLGLQGTF
jgi:hypothetical protein